MDTDDLLLAISDVNCEPELYAIVREIQQTIDSKTEFERDELNRALFLAKLLVTKRVLH